MWRVVHSQLRHDFVCRFLRMSGECAQNLQTLNNTRQMTATQTRITEGAETRVVRHRNTRSSAAGDRNHQPQWITGLVNEQEQSQPQRIHARHQGTQSPQISVTLGHFNYQPIIWHRGPRPRAHWYMYADVANPSNCHNYSPPSMGGVLTTQNFSSWG